MDLSIIVVSFNVKNLLRDCLRSVISSHRSLATEIIVVDNASTDGSAEMVRKEFSKVKLIENKENFGFARAINQGIRIAKGEYLFLLNSDAVVKGDALNKLLELAKKQPEVGILGARILNPNGSIQPSVYHLPTIWRAIKEFWLGQKGAYEKYAVTGTDPVSVEAVTGAAMLIPRKTIDKVGLLDERYFMYFEDLDYCRRVKKAGMKVFYLPAAEIIHHHGASGPPKITYQYSVNSSKIYNGTVKYYLLTLIIWLGQRWQKILKF